MKNMNLVELKNYEDHRKRQELKLVDIEPISQRIKKFPSTRFYGSKRKLLHWIYENIKGLDFETALDGFGGTGSVSLLFKAMHKDVTYHDAFLFSKHVAQTVLGNDLCISEDAFGDFVNTIRPKNGIIYNNFQGLYYKNNENRWLDGFARKVFSSNLTARETSLYMYCLYQACLKKRPFNIFHRTNLNLRTNKKVHRNFGNYTTWERTFPELMLQSYQEIKHSLFTSKGTVRILKSSCVTKIRNGYDLVYLDPPYVNLIDKYNRDDYWMRYHFLEGLSQYPDWQKQIDQKAYLKFIPAPQNFLEWNRKKTFKEKLFKLIEKHKDSITVLSYVSNSYPDENDIGHLFKSVFSKVSIHSKEHTHVLSKQNKRELLFIGRP